MPYLPPEIWVIIFRSLANSQDFAAIWNNGRCASPYFKTLIESVFRIDILPVMVTNLSLVGCTARRGVERVLLDFKGLSGDGERAYFGEKNQATKGTGGPELQHKGDRRGLSANQSSNIAPGLPCSPPILIEWTSHFCISVARGPTSFVGKHGGVPGHHAWFKPGVAPAMQMRVDEEAKEVSFLWKRLMSNFTASLDNHPLVPGPEFCPLSTGQPRK